MSSKIITVWGATGSGKTSIAANLGIAIADRNLMVGIISSKLYYGELQSIFGKRLEHDKGIYNAI
ncbi:MAG: cobalamin biosynthesis protein CobQ, partial [Clostridia bacterium]|nr:cobalamin biosynthesis protein CobQ [Clostridia bacterium]